MAGRFRREKDYLGDVLVPSNSYYGAQTARAIKNFQISGLHFPHEFTKSYAILKRAAAISNGKSGSLNKTRCAAIVKACDEIISGKFDREFVLDVYQAGAGTSTNMNLNEVIANRAIEILGGRKGDYKIVHPNDHVNMSQSTNDTFHSTMHISAVSLVEKRLLPSVDKLASSLDKKSKDFSKIMKTGRTHTRFAVPMSLGDEFSGYSETMKKHRKFLETATNSMRELNIGGTAVGTGLNAGPRFSENVVAEINKQTGLGFRRARNTFSMTQNTEAELEVLDSIKDMASSLVKISNDIMYFSSSDVGELTIPSVQPGSSIMPGKVNPSVAEMMNMVAYQVIGSDLTVTLALQSGKQELNVMMPVIAYNLLFSIEIMSNSIETFTEKLVKGIRPNLAEISKNLERNPEIATALVPSIGFEKAAEIVKESQRSGRSVREIVLARRILSEPELDRLLGKVSKRRR